MAVLDVIVVVVPAALAGLVMSVSIIKQCERVVLFELDEVKTLARSRGRMPATADQPPSPMNGELAAP